MALDESTSRLPWQDQRGDIIVLFPVVLALILTLAAFILGVGVLFNSSVRLQNTANLASLAASEVFNKEATLPITARLKEAQKAVDRVLSENSITFLNESYKKVKIWDGTDTPETPEMKVGFWFYENLPDCSLDTPALYTGCDCPQGPPCFIPLSENQLKTVAQSPNAIEVNIKPKSGSLKLPLGSMIFGKAETDIQAKGLATAVERCTVFLLDVSTSGFASSHQHYAPNIWQKTMDLTDPAQNPSDPFVEDPNVIFPFRHPSHYCNDEGALYPLKSGDAGYPGYPIYKLRSAYDFADISKGDVLNAGNYAILAPASGNMSNYNCAVPISRCTSGLSASAFDAYAQWCAMHDERPNSCKTAPDPSTCELHYRSDFEVETTVSGGFAIDRFTAPEPLTSVMMAANGGLREVQAKGTSIDKVAIIPFSHALHGPVPFTGLSRDLRFPVDMTDMRRGGKRTRSATSLPWETSGEVSPNFIDRDWFPVRVWGSLSPPRAGTDILGALNAAVERLTNAEFCATEGRKSIILATDGIMTHTYSMANAVINWGSGARVIANWSDNLEAERALLDRVYPNALLKRMVDAKIRVTTLLTGDIVDPNFANEIKNPGPPRQFMTMAELGGKGFRGFPDLSLFPPERAISETEPQVPNNLPSFVLYTASGAPTACNSAGPDYNMNECARKYSTQIPGFKYRRPNAIFSQLSILSGGLFCPLMDPYKNLDKTVNTDCYDKLTGYWKDGDSDCLRNEAFQHYSVYGQERGGQAAECVRLSMGRPPFSLVIEPPK